MIEVGIGLGSNIGDKVGHLQTAAMLLRARGIVPDLVLSSFYRTEPWGNREQDWFVNACGVGHTGLAPAALLEAVKALEVEIGRTATVRWGPRVIDIDLLYLGDLSIDTTDLVLPHRELRNRAFVLVPLAELRPDLRLEGHSVGELAAGLCSNGIERLDTPVDPGLRRELDDTVPPS